MEINRKREKKRGCVTYGEEGKIMVRKEQWWWRNGGDRSSMEGEPTLTTNLSPDYCSHSCHPSDYQTATENQHWLRQNHLTFAKHPPNHHDTTLPSKITPTTLKTTLTSTKAIPPTKTTPPTPKITCTISKPPTYPKVTSITNKTSKLLYLRDEGQWRWRKGGDKITPNNPKRT